MVFHIFLAVFGKNPAKRGKNRPNKCQNPAKTSIFVPFEAVHGFSRLVTGSRVVPDWFPISKKVVLEFAESGVKFWPEICRIG